MKKTFLLTSALMAGLAACSEKAATPEPERFIAEQAEPVAPANTDVAPGEPFSDLYLSWIEPAEPFRVIGNVYFVGTTGLGMYLIDTGAGLIVLDGGLERNADMVLSSIRALGFDPADVKILLNTHAHLDHSGGLARIKEVTGAKLIASKEDQSALEGGFYLGSEDNHSLDAPPVNVDANIADGETVSLGNTTLTARLTPGHTRGCTSWWMTVEENGTPYEVLFFCSATVAANRLAPDPQYEGIVADYRHTFEITKDWTPDVFLANHPEFTGLWQTRTQQLAGDKLAFVDRTIFPAYISELETDFTLKLVLATVHPDTGEAGQAAPEDD